MGKKSEIENTDNQSEINGREPSLPEPQGVNGREPALSRVAVTVLIAERGNRIKLSKPMYFAVGVKPKVGDFIVLNEETHTLEIFGQGKGKIFGICVENQNTVELMISGTLLNTQGFIGQFEGIMK